MNAGEHEQWLRGLVGDELDHGPDAPGPHLVEDEELLARWSAERLTPRERNEFLAHIARCALCRRTLGELIDSGIIDPPPVADQPQPQPQRARQRWPMIIFGIVATTTAALLLAVYLSSGRGPGSELAAARQAADAGRPQEAIEHLERLLASNPNPIIVREARELLRQVGLDVARVDLKAGRFDAVRELADRLAKFDVEPGRMANLRLRAEHHRTTELALADAGTLLDYGYETDGRVRRKGLIELNAEFLHRLKDWQAATARHADEPSLHLNLGQHYLAARESEKALAEFTAAAHSGPTAETHTGTGLALFQLEQFDAARRAFQAAVDLQPDSAAAHVNLAATLERLGKPAEARPHWLKARELATDPELRRQIEWHLNRPPDDD